MDGEEEGHQFHSLTLELIRDVISSWGIPLLSWEEVRLGAHQQNWGDSGLSIHDFSFRIIPT